MHYMIALFLTQIWNIRFDASTVDSLKLLRQYSHTVKRGFYLLSHWTCKDTSVDAHGEDTGRLRKDIWTCFITFIKYCLAPILVVPSKLPFWSGTKGCKLL